MKTCRLVLTLLILLVIGSAVPCTNVADVRAATLPQDPIEQAIIQALEATAQELGDTEASVDITRMSGDEATYTIYIAQDPVVFGLTVRRCFSSGEVQYFLDEAAAANSSAQQTTFYGYPAVYLPRRTASDGRTNPDELDVAIDQFLFHAQFRSYRSDVDWLVMEVAEIFYRHAVASGFMVADDAPDVATLTPPPTPTPSAALNLSLQASRSTLPADGTSTAQITLRVTDLNGNPLPGRSIDLALRGEDGQGTIQPIQGITDANGLLMVTYTAFKPSPGSRFASHEHQVTLTATDRETGETTTLELNVNQNQITVVGNQYIPPCSRCLFPAQLYFTMRDAWGNPIPNAQVTVRLEGPYSTQGTLVTTVDSNERNTELRLQTAQDGSVRLYYRWLGGSDVVEVLQQVVILEEQTNALVVREVTVHGLDLAIARVEEAGFTGVTNQQAFFKIYVRDRIHPDLDLGRFNLDAPNQIGLRVHIYQFESEGTGTSLPFESTGGWEVDEGGLYVRLPATPHLPYVIPVNDGTTWYEIRVDAVDRNDVYLPDSFRGNNDTIIALTTGSPEGWLHTWLSDGPLTPRSYTGVVFKCVARFLPGLGDAITVIDTLGQVYNTDVLGLGQSTAQVLIENVQRRGIKASTINNIASCMQDAYGVYTESSQGSGLPGCGSCARLATLRPAAPCALPAEDFDIDVLHHDMDQFIHGLLLDAVDERAIVVSGLSDTDVTLLGAQGRPVDDPDLVSAGSGVVVYVVPAQDRYTLEVTGRSPFDLAVYQTGANEGVRQTYRHALQPEGEVSASMPIGGDSDYALAVDENGDGAPDGTLQARAIPHDVVRPVITGLYPAPDSILYRGLVTIAAEFTDDTGGSGIDHAVLRVLLDGQDVTGLAAIGADRLTLQIGDLLPGEHGVRVEVSDLEGNRTISEWSFVVESGWAGLLTSPLLLPVAAGGAGLLLLGLVTLLAVVLVRRRRPGPRPAASATQHRMTQDAQGHWWSQDPASGAWFYWDGTAWQPWQAPVTHGAPPKVRRSG